MAVTSGSESQVNTYTTQYQQDQKVTALPDGGWVISWASFGQEIGYDLYQQVFNADGTARGGETRINDYTNFSQNVHSVAVLDDGGWVVAYGSMDSDSVGIRMQRFDSNGNTVGSEVTVNTYQTGAQQTPQIVALNNGGWVISWVSVNQDGGQSIGSSDYEWGVYQQAYDVNGDPVGGETQVHTHFDYHQGYQQMIALNDGGWLVTYYSSSFPDSHIMMQRFDASGNAVGDETQIDPEDLDGQEIVSEPQITLLPTGGWVVTWETYQHESSGRTEVFQRVFSSNGLPRGDAEKVGSVHGENHGAPQVITLADGGWVVAWRGAATGTDKEKVAYKQTYNADGSKRGDMEQVNTIDTGIFTINWEFWPKMIALEDGGYVIAWNSDIVDSDAKSIHLQIYNADGTKRGGEKQVNDVEIGDQKDPELTALEGGSFVITWESFGQDGDNLGVFQKVFDSVQDFRLNGNSANNVLKGDWGHDVLKGAKGKDKLIGMDGNDKLVGGKHNDVLVGGNGKDKFVFKPQEGTDTIKDFQNGKDLIDLRGFGFSGKGKALKKFKEWGTADDDKVKFSHDGTTIKIKGVDLSDINKADLII